MGISKVATMFAVHQVLHPAVHKIAEFLRWSCLRQHAPIKVATYGRRLCCCGYQSSVVVTTEVHDLHAGIAVT